MSAETGSAADRAAGRAAAPNRRERARAATYEEIKQTALELMREQGTTDVRFADIARAMGLTAPALYRYFADRDALLTAMVVDSFDDLSAALSAGRESVDPDDLGGRMLATCQAYRRWASQNPQRFALIFGLPVPGYAAPEHGPTTEAAKRALANLEGLVIAALDRGELGEPLIREVGPAFRVAAECNAVENNVDIAGPTYQAMLHAWAALHGFTCLEVYDHLNWIDEAARDELFASQIRAAAVAAGLPLPR